MEGILYKINNIYALMVNGKMVASNDEDFQIDYAIKKLSLKNCEAVANGYDLDELAEQEFPYDFDCPLFETLGITEKSHKSILIGMLQGTLQKGFQKALELIGDKKFSEDDLANILVRFLNDIKNMKYRGDEVSIINQLLQSLQQTEWDVTFNPDEKDSNGCLILKRK